MSDVSSQPPRPALRRAFSFGDVMGVLSNPRHERFAQELAKGKTQEQAYIDAGYSEVGARANASACIIANHNIMKRVAELQERGAIRVELTLADIIAEIEQARVMALAAETVQASAAVSASKAKAELLGLGAAKKIDIGGSENPVQLEIVRRVIDPRD
ncbi:MAG: terminase small subunit [Rhodocyclaceae bacterium]|nr:terminase small subunit [Rhodocyclaceae bacterium]